MRILAIETSCDDTCVAVIEARNKTKPRFKILSNIISSQVKIHLKYGGVYPFLAKREHQKNLPQVLKKALNKAKNPKINLVAVTQGPGLEPCLWVGINFAKELTKNWRLPLMPVNHIEGHIVANFLHPNNQNLFPAICLIVSGGHTQLILMKSLRHYQVIGETRDDAAGECLDKTARILGLGYPGGPVISKMAEKHQGYLSINLPRPMIHQKNYDFSFSGLKTAVLYHHRSQPKKIRESKKYIQAMAQEIQQSIIDVLIYKTLKAAKNHKVKSIILGGGVVANNQLKKQFKAACLKSNFAYLAPDKIFCTDNAAMAGMTAFLHWPQDKVSSEKIKAEANLRL